MKHDASMTTESLEFMQQVGHILRHRKEKLGLHAVEVARRAGVTRSSVYRVFEGQAVAMHQYLQVAEALGCSLELEMEGVAA
jgi:predicted transcriptional regulator